MAFPPASRLTEKGSFKNVFAKQVRVKRSSSFSIFMTPSNQPRARLGMVVAKRNVRHAVARKRLKRLIRESFRLGQQLLAGWDVVVVVKKDFETLGHEKNKLRAFFGGYPDVTKNSNISY